MRRVGCVDVGMIFALFIIFGVLQKLVVDGVKMTMGHVEMSLIFN